MREGVGAWRLWKRVFIWRGCRLPTDTDTPLLPSSCLSRRASPGGRLFQEHRILEVAARMYPSMDRPTSFLMPPQKGVPNRAAPSREQDPGGAARVRGARMGSEILEGAAPVWMRSNAPRQSAIIPKSALAKQPHTSKMRAPVYPSPPPPRGGPHEGGPHGEHGEGDSGGGPPVCPVRMRPNAPRQLATSPKGALVNGLAPAK